MNLYVTTEEIKTFMGIATGVTTYDTLIAMFNKMATSVVNSILGAKDLSLHKVTDEVQDAQNQYLNLYEAPIVAIEKIMDDDVEYTQDEAYDILLNRVRLENWLTYGPRKTKITYAAGYHAYGYTKITITDIANLAAAATITLGAVATDGFTITRGTDWNLATSAGLEAINIAAAINAKAGTNAFAISNIVYVIEATNPQVITRTITASDLVRLAMSTTTLTGLNFPEDIRLAIMVYVSNLMNIRKNPKIRSYSIGGKSVSFASDAEFNQFNDLLKPFKKFGVKAI